MGEVKKVLGSLLDIAGRRSSLGRRRMGSCLVVARTAQTVQRRAGVDSRRTRAWTAVRGIAVPDGHAAQKVGTCMIVPC